MDIIKNSDINFLSSEYAYASGKNDNSIYFTRDEVGSIIVNGKIYGQSNYTNISYNKLVNLRNTGALQTGVLYRITDYVTTTSQSRTNSAGHVFDIIVIALSNNKCASSKKNTILGFSLSPASGNVSNNSDIIQSIKVEYMVGELISF